MPAKIAARKSSSSTSWRRLPRKVGGTKPSTMNRNASRRRRVATESGRTDDMEDEEDEDDESADDVVAGTDVVEEGRESAAAENVELGSTVRQFAMGDFKLSMWIPSDLAGRVIGKKGIVISNMQRETKAKLINALPPVGDTLWIAVVIIGEMRSICAAYRAISDLVEEEVDEVVMEFTINYRRHFFLSGPKKFAILKRISATTNVRIFFPEFNPKEQAFSQAKPVSLEGDFSNVCEAVKMFDVEAVEYLEQQKKKHSEGDGSRLAKVPAMIDCDGSVNSPDRGSSAPEKSPDTGSQNQQEHSAPSQKESSISVEEASASRTAETEAIPTRKRVRIEKHIDIPENLVGLLLSKRGKNLISTMNSIQKYTHTIISKVRGSKTEGGSTGACSPKDSTDDKEILSNIIDSQNTDDAAVDGNRRRRTVDTDVSSEAAREEENEDDEEEEDNEDDSGFDDARDPGDAMDDGEEQEDVEDSDNDSAEFESAGEGSGSMGDRNSEQEPGSKAPPENVEATSSTNGNDREVEHVITTGAVVTFLVVSNAEESVDMVIRALKRIIDGDMIKEVMVDLRKEGKQFAQVYAQKKMEAAAAAGTAPGVPVKRKINVSDVKKRRGHPIRTKLGSERSFPKGTADKHIPEVGAGKERSFKSNRPLRKKLPEEADAGADTVRGDERIPRNNNLSRGVRGKSRNGPPASPSSTSGTAASAEVKAGDAKSAANNSSGGSAIGVFKKRT